MSFKNFLNKNDTRYGIKNNEVLLCIFSGWFMNFFRYFGSKMAAVDTSKKQDLFERESYMAGKVF